MDYRSVPIRIHNELCRVRGLIRRWVAYPIKFVPYMDAMTFFAIIMGASFVMYGLPVLFTLLGVKTSLFWQTSGFLESLT